MKEIGTKKKPIKTSMLRFTLIIVGILLPLGLMVFGGLMLAGVVDPATILAGLPVEVLNIAPIALLAVGAVGLIISWAIAYAKSRTKYFLSECMLLEKVGSSKETCKVILKPGMGVSIRKNTIKSRLLWFLGLDYGDVIIKLGPSEAGEVVLRDVKHPKRVKENLDEAIKKNCVSFSRTMVFSV